MENLVSLYTANADLIEKFIISSLRKVGLTKLDQPVIDKLFSIFPNLELIYACDSSLKQTSPNYFRNTTDNDPIGSNRNYLIKHIDKEQGYCISDPYISTASGRLCVTVAYVTSEGYVLLDFYLRGLLERFDIIERNDAFKRFNRSSYLLIGSGLIFFGLFVVLYGFYTFATYLFGVGELSLDSVFKPVIALTLGLAVFDLGKTIVEEEVVPRAQKIKTGFNPKTLMNFAVSIIIALLIEALLVVFKISISDYRDLAYAAWLIGALAILLLVFGIFVYLVRRSESKSV